MTKGMKVFMIPQRVRDEAYKEGGETYKGDEGKCGGCNWSADTVYMMGRTLKDAIDAFRENHRGLCGLCMTQLLEEGDYRIHSKVEEKAHKNRKASTSRRSPGNSIRGIGG